LAEFERPSSSPIKMAFPRVEPDTAVKIAPLGFVRNCAQRLIENALEPNPNGDEASVYCVDDRAEFAHKIDPELEIPTELA